MGRRTKITGAAVLKDGPTSVFRFASIKAQLRLEKLGMKSSGGALRPRLQAQAEWAHLKKTSPHADYIHVCELALCALGHPDFQTQELIEEAADLWPQDESVHDVLN